MLYVQIILKGFFLSFWIYQAFICKWKINCTLFVIVPNVMMVKSNDTNTNFFFSYQCFCVKIKSVCD